jgi:prepilin-type processing-associated H-X9-DG protein
MRKKTKPKFTLAELLVIVCVVAIIIICAQSWFKSKREMARRISCTGHLIHIGLTIRMYSQENKLEFPNRPGRSGFEMLRSGAYLENCKLYTCPSTTDKIPDGSNLAVSSVSYLYACGLNEATSVDSAVARDNDANHIKYGNVLFVDGHASGYAGANWTTSANYLGSSIFSY